ncbi:O-antigen ligase family protein [Algoriphagus algorifonticola]|uniref:O-antigen ligase family protein n=1 Tax=Algoriphagus algorifonticola TaxID=2593007 RepID=UPI001C92FFC0|nr:O-antigen ligase family protein [Algoriphagus algorifonticola]
MTFTYLLVDCFNGLLMRIGIGISISQLYKIGLLAGMLLFLLGRRPIAFLAAFGLILFFLIPLLFKSLLSGDTSTFVGNFGYNLKLILFPVSFLFFSNLELSRENLKAYWKSFAWFNFILIAFNIFLGVLGVGYSQYDSPEGQGIGGRGFFFAGNEVAGIFLLFSGVCWYLTKNLNGISRFLFFLLLLVLGVLNTSKTAILGIILIVGLIEVPKFFTKRMSLGRFLGLLSLPLLVIGLVGIIYWGIQATGLIDRIAFFYDKLDLLTFILSGRNQMVQGALTFYPSMYSFWDYLFGVGNQEFLKLMGIYHGNPHTIEIDFFDLLFMNGFLGLSLVLGIFVWATFRSLTQKQSKSPIWAINLVLLFVSFMAGHIFNSAMLGISLGMLNGLGFKYWKN